MELRIELPEELLAGALRDALANVVGGERVVQVSRPSWGSYAVCKSYFTDLKRDRLAEWVGKGWVRKHKSGEAKQAAATYSLDDIDRVYSNEAEGKRVRRVRR